MILAYTSKLDFKIKRTNAGTQKIDSSLLTTFKMVITGLQVINKLDKAWFSKKYSY